MDRKIVSVTPAERGWNVECPEQALQELGDMHAALFAAWNLARDVYRATGHPTAVKVKMGYGDGIMIGYHG